jgi:hypothetical protein
MSVCVVSGNLRGFGPIGKQDDSGWLHWANLERAGSTDELHVSNMYLLSVVSVRLMTYRVQGCM